MPPLVILCNTPDSPPPARDPINRLAFLLQEFTFAPEELKEAGLSEELVETLTRAALRLETLAQG